MAKLTAEEAEAESTEPPAKMTFGRCGTAPDLWIIKHDSDACRATSGCAQIACSQHHSRNCMYSEE